MKFEETCDADWEFIKSYPPLSASTGRTRADDKKAISGILNVTITSCKWLDIPHAYQLSFGA